MEGEVICPALFPLFFPPVIVEPFRDISEQHVNFLGDERLRAVMFLMLPYLTSGDVWLSAD
jgi:hypothetical protein